MKQISVIFLFLMAGLWSNSLLGQDTRERHYYYEILEPRNEGKPEVKGYATQRIEEKLGRGLVLNKINEGKAVYVSWRLLKTDGESVGFNVYRSVNGKAKKLNKKAITKTTDFVDTNPQEGDVAYWIETVDGKNKTNSEKKSICAISEGETNYTSIKLKDPNLIAGRVALADLDGDGEYDYIIRHPHTGVDPGMPGDSTGITYKIEAYLSDGTYLWTKDLGLGIEPGIWYSPFIAYDFDGDGKAEVVLKTSGSDYKRDSKHRVYGGSEFLTILDGMTGKEIAQVDWPERNDRYGNLNRQNRNQIGMAYLDGKTPCILAARGTYKLMVVDAWQLNNGKLEKLWRWDGDEENPIVRSQGAHNMVCGDVNGDGTDEILLGSCLLNSNGTLRWSTGLGHSDKAYLTDIDPTRKGLEVFLALEPWHDNGYGVCMVDADSGKRIWGIGHKTFHVGDGMVTDLDPTKPGLECFASEDKKGGSTDKYLLSAQGEKIGMNEDVPPCRNWLWWDAGKTRQLISGDFVQSTRKRVNKVEYWKGEVLAKGIEGSILMTADISGDWREEIVTALPGEIRIYHTSHQATDRRVSLMQDPIYRSYVLQNSQGYYQSPVTGYYLGN